MGEANFADVIFGKLTGKALAVLFAFALLLTAAILGIAVYRGSAVDLWIIKIQPQQEPAKAAAAPVRIKLSLEFEPAVNARAPGVTVKAISKGADGTERSLQLLRQGIESGSMYVETELPDLQTPMFIEVSTPKGVWRTDDFSLSQSKLRALKFSPEEP